MRVSTFFLLFVSLLLSSCKSYKPITLSAEELLAREEFANGYKNYVYYVHQGDSQIVLETPTIEGDRINAVISSQPALNKKDISRKARKEIIHLHIDSAISLDSALLQDSIVSIPTSQISKVETYAKKRGSILSTILYVLLGIVVGLVLLVLIIIGLLFSSDGSSSNSGNGGNGGNGGGGNTSNSSCYVATMVYGNCDAEEVLVLRKFRDQVLKQYRLGRKFVAWYYKNSPAFVAKHRSKMWVHKTIKSALDPMVKLIGSMLNK